MQVLISYHYKHTVKSYQIPSTVCGKDPEKEGLCHQMEMSFLESQTCLEAARNPEDHCKILGVHAYSVVQAVLPSCWVGGNRPSEILVDNVASTYHVHLLTLVEGLEEYDAEEGAVPGDPSPIQDQEELGVPWDAVKSGLVEGG